jgi:hypothetical protein
VQRVLWCHAQPLPCFTQTPEPLAANVPIILCIAVLPVRPQALHRAAGDCELHPPLVCCPFPALFPAPWELQLHTHAYTAPSPPPVCTHLLSCCPRARKRRERPRDKRRREHRELVAQRKWERDHKHEWTPETLASEWHLDGTCSHSAQHTVRVRKDRTGHCLNPLGRAMSYLQARKVPAATRTPTACCFVSLLDKPLPSLCIPGFSTPCLCRHGSSVVVW